MNIFKEDPKTKKGKALLLTSFALGGLVIGGGLGVLFSYLIKNPKVDMSKVSVKNDVYDVQELQRKVQKSIADGKDVTQEYSLSEIAHYALDNFTLAENSIAIGYGFADAAVKLDIRNFTIKNGDKFMEEALSKSLPGAMIDIRVCQRDYQDGVNNDSPIKSYLGDVKDAEHPNYDNPTINDYTAETYKDKFGKTLDDPSVYVVSSKTILTDTVTQKGSDGQPIMGASCISKVEGGYKLYMELNTTTGVAKYYKRMINLSGSNVSSFSYIHLTYNLNDNLELVSSFVEEYYSAGIGNVQSNVKGTLTTYFFKDTNDYVIPDINSYVTYPEEGKLR